MISTNYQVGNNLNRMNFGLTQKQHSNKSNNISFNGKKEIVEKFMSSIYTDFSGKYPDQHYAFNNDEIGVLARLPEKILESLEKRYFHSESKSIYEFEQKIVDKIRKKIINLYLKNEAPEVLELFKKENSSKLLEVLKSLRLITPSETTTTQKTFKVSDFSVATLKKMKSKLEHDAVIQRSIDGFKEGHIC